MLVDQGRMPRRFTPSLVGINSWANSTQSHNKGLVSRGSMISSMPKLSAVRNGERSSFNISSISRRLASGSGEDSMSRLYPASNRQSSPSARRPRVAQVERLRGAVGRAGHSEHPSQDDRNPGHGRLINGGHRPRAVTGRARAFGPRADQEAGLIDEVHDRQM